MSKIIKTTLVLMIVTMISKVMGFGRELVLASVYGASKYSDAYLIAVNIPNVIFSGIGAALATTIVPMYYRVKNEKGINDAQNFINNVFNIVMLTGITFVILGLIFTKPLVKVFAIGLEGESLNISIKFTKIIIISVIFIGLNNIITAFLQINDNFTIPGLIGIPYNIIIIIAIIISIIINPDILAYGTLLAIMSQFLFQIYFANKKGFKYKFYININDKYIKQMIKLIVPVLLGVGVNQINTMIDRSLASTLSVGSISALNYAGRLNTFVMVLITTSIASVIYPMISKTSLDDNKEEFNKSIVSSINSVIILILPISIGAIIFSNPIVKLLFERGAFDDRASEMTAIALVFYSIGMVAFGLRDILGKIFYSLQDTKTPMINGALTMTLNIVLNLILVKSMGHAGLAFATSISAIVCTILLFKSLHKRVCNFCNNIVKVIFKSLISSIIMAMIIIPCYKVVYSFMQSTAIAGLVALSGSILVGAILYSIFMTILKVEEFIIIKKYIKSKLSKEYVLN